MTLNPFAILRQKRDDRLRKTALELAISARQPHWGGDQVALAADKFYTFMTEGDTMRHEGPDKTDAFLGIYG